MEIIIGIFFMIVLVLSSTVSSGSIREAMEMENYIDMGKYLDGYSNTYRLVDKAIIRSVNGMLKIYEIISYSDYLANIPIDKITNIYLRDNRKKYIDTEVRGFFSFSFSAPQIKTILREDKFALIIQWVDGGIKKKAVFAFFEPNAEKRATHAANELIKICGLPQVVKIN